MSTSLLHLPPTLSTPARAQDLFTGLPSAEDRPVYLTPTGHTASPGLSDSRDGELAHRKFMESPWLPNPHHMPELLLNLTNAWAACKCYLVYFIANKWNRQVFPVEHTVINIPKLLCIGPRSSPSVLTGSDAFQTPPHGGCQKGREGVSGLLLQPAEVWPHGECGAEARGVSWTDILACHTASGLRFPQAPSYKLKFPGSSLKQRSRSPVSRLIPWAGSWECENESPSVS